MKTQQFCSVESCERNSITRGWCAKHYARWQRHGDPTFILTKKRQVESSKESKSTYMRRVIAMRILLGGVCAQCGSTAGLHFDHIDPATKSFELAGAWDRGITAILEEMLKCQVLCKPCHVQKTRRENPRRKIDYQQAQEIRALAAAGLSQSELSRRYGIVQSSISNIIHNRRWQTADAV